MIDGSSIIKLHAVSVVVDKSVDPWEVITWMITRKFDFKEGVVLYDREKETTEEL